MGFVKDIANKGANLIGAGQQKSINPYQFDATAFDLSEEDRRRAEQDRLRQSSFIDSIEGQVQGFDPLLNMLSKQALGQGPSLADMQLKQATNRNIAQQMGVAAGNRAINPALAARMAGQNIGNINQEAAGQSAEARLAEMLQAQNQEIAARQAKSGVTTQGGNLASQSRTQGMQFDDANRQAKVDLERMRGDQYLGAQGINTSRFDSGQGRRGNFISNLSGGMAAVLSDENVKTDKKKSSKDIDGFLDAIEAYTFKYKDDPKKENHVGVMAQDLEKSKIGKMLVVDGPEGKEIDMKKALAAVLASQAHINKKIKGNKHAS